MQGQCVRNPHAHEQEHIWSQTKRQTYTWSQHYEDHYTSRDMSDVPHVKGDHAGTATNNYTTSKAIFNNLQDSFQVLGTTKTTFYGKVEDKCSRNKTAAQAIHTTQNLQPTGGRSNPEAETDGYKGQRFKKKLTRKAIIDMVNSQHLTMEEGKAELKDLESRETKNNKDKKQQLPVRNKGGHATTPKEGPLHNIIEEGKYINTKNYASKNDKAPPGPRPFMDRCEAPAENRSSDPGGKAERTTPALKKTVDTNTE